MRLLTVVILRETVAWFALYTLGYLSVAVIALCVPLLHSGAPVGAVADFMRQQIVLLGITVMPIALVTGIVTVVGRMRDDGEIVALRASGLSTWVVARSMLPLALFVAGLDAYAVHRILPEAYRTMLDTSDSIIRQAVAVKVKRHAPVFSSDGLMLAATGIDGDVLVDVFARKSTAQHGEFVVFAPRARWAADQAGLSLLLESPIGLHTVDHPGKPREAVGVDVERFWSVLLESRIDNADHEDALPTSALATRIAEGKAGKRPRKELRDLERAYHQRYAWPVGVIMFWALASGLGLAIGRGGRMFAVLVSVGSILVVIILPMLIAKNMRSVLPVSPGWILWPPIIACGAIGVGLLWKQR